MEIDVKKGMIGCWVIMGKRSGSMAAVWRKGYASIRLKRVFYSRFFGNVTWL